MLVFVAFGRFHIAFVGPIPRTHPHRSRNKSRAEAQTGRDLGAPRRRRRRRRCQASRAPYFFGLSLSLCRFPKREIQDASLHLGGSIRQEAENKNQVGNACEEDNYFETIAKYFDARFGCLWGSCN